MKVTLISATTDAVNLLLFTKATRLNMTPGLLDEIAGWSAEKKAAQLAYMANTIRSSWEFVDLMFLVEGVSRACAQQITRTRWTPMESDMYGSYAMQSQRVTDVRAMPVAFPEFKDEHQARVWDTAVAAAKDAYGLLIDDGMPPQDARGILPINVECNLVIKYNLRTFTEIAAARSSLRAQGEYADMVAEMKRLTIEEWPWSAPFFEHPADAAIKMLEGIAKDLGITTGSGPGWQIAKAIDLLRKG